jgi:hypothetical protein
MGGGSSRISDQSLSRQKHKTLSEKQTKAKRAGGVAQMLEYLPWGPEFRPYYHQKNKERERE